MRRIAMVVLSIAAAVAVATPAQAATYVDTAANALASGKVYVAGGLPYTDDNTAGNLANQMTSDDNVAIVMLPAEAIAETSGSMSQFASALDAATGHKFVIGLSIGTQFTAVADSSLMPSGVASDEMKRAASVATNPVETMTTFIRNIHDWEAANPQAKVSQGQTKKKGGFPVMKLVLALVAFAVVLVLIIIGFNYLNRPPGDRKPKEVKLPDPPSDVMHMLNDIRQLIPQVNNMQVRSTLTQACSDVVLLFDRLKKNVDPQKLKLATSKYKDYLTEVKTSLDCYIDVQNNPRTYRGEPSDHLLKGAKGFDGFAEGVLDAIKSANEGKLAELTVSSAILDSTRY